MEQMSSPKQYHVHYGSASNMARVDIGELWRYKDLIWLFVKRDFTVLYKQTVSFWRRKRTSVSLSCRSSRRSIIFPTISSVR